MDRFELNGISGANGSCVISTADSSIKLAVAVHGPMAMKSRNEDAMGAVLSVHWEAYNTAPSVHINCLALRLEQLLKSSIMLEMHPRTQIAIHIEPLLLTLPVSWEHSLSQEYKLLAAAFNAAIIAMVHANIPLRALPVAVLLSEHSLSIWEHGTDRSDRIVSRMQHLECIDPAAGVDAVQLEQSSLILYSHIKSVIDAFYQ